MPKKDNHLLEQVEESTTVTMIALGFALFLFGMSFLPGEYEYFEKTGIAMGASGAGVFILTHSLLLWSKAKGRWVKWVKYAITSFSIILIVTGFISYVLSFFIDYP